jgi:hypothetical protein
MTLQKLARRKLVVLRWMASDVSGGRAERLPPRIFKVEDDSVTSQNRSDTTLNKQSAHCFLLVIDMTTIATW